MQRTATPQDTADSREGTSAAESPGSTEENDGEPQQVAGWSECNVCFEVAKDPVVGNCGHLFCWPCIYQWLEARGNSATCPVCKSAIDKDHLVPIYGRGNGKQEDPRTKVPPRPQGQRQEREAQHDGGIFGTDAFNVSFGIGAFPIGLFTGPLHTVFGGQQQQQQQNVVQPALRRQRREEQILARVFLFATVLMILWLFVS